MVYVNPTVDGDPRYLPARLVSLNLVAPFSGVTRVINEVRHELGPELDYVCTVLLSETDVRPPPAQMIPFQTHSEQLSKIADGLRKTSIGKQPLSPY